MFSDGVDDELTASAVEVTQPNTVGVLFRSAGTNATLKYLLGQYAAVSYQFFTLNDTGDIISGDPITGGAFTSAGIGAAHLWLFSKNGASLQFYRDGVALAARPSASASGTPGAFWLCSAGGSDYSAVEIAEVFNIDRAITANEAVSLTNYFRAEGYPL